MFSSNAASDSVERVGGGGWLWMLWSGIPFRYCCQDTIHVSEVGGKRTRSDIGLPVGWLAGCKAIHGKE